MTAVMVEIASRPATTEDPDEIVLVTDAEELTVGTTPGCGDDNPYN
ncbi:hypothetical protein [Streptomyces sp. NPDC002758]